MPKSSLLPWKYRKANSEFDYKWIIGIFLLGIIDKILTNYSAVYVDFGGTYKNLFPISMFLIIFIKKKIVNLFN